MTVSRAVSMDIPAIFRAGVVAGLRVERLSYSAAPWRIVASDGQELATWVTHPSPGVPPYQAPMAYERKRDAIAALQALRAKEASR